MDFTIMASSFPKLLGAAAVTLKLLTLSLFFGVLIGLLFAILRLNKNSYLSKFAYGYSYVFRGTPLLVQIFIIYFGLGQIEFFRTTFLWVIFKEPYWCAIIAFSLNTGAYTSEILRSAFETIKPGIIEAAKSLGIFGHDRVIDAAPTPNWTTKELARISRMSKCILEGFCRHTLMIQMLRPKLRRRRR